MRRVFSAFLLVSVYTGSLIANEAPVISRVVPYVSSTNQPSGRQQDTTRATISRVLVPSDTVTDNLKIVPSVQTRDIANIEKSDLSDEAPQELPVNASYVSKRIAAAAAANNTNNTSSARGAVNRSAKSTSGRESLESVAGNVGRSTRTSGYEINNTPQARRVGVSLRPSTAEVGGRAIIAGTNIQTGSNVNFGQERSVQSRAAKSDVTAESISAAKERLEQTASLNKSCQEQYNDCMDQFCAVIDQNQKRCSCSANLARYSKSEEAVKGANTELNEVAQLIRYVGLSADEIRAIMNATEAEIALSGTKDNTESRNMLDEIENLIKSPTGSSSYMSDDYVGLDLDIDFSSDTSDIFSLDFLNDSGSSFSNLRGRELYNAAKKRCNSVINQCKGAGATIQQVTGNYDLAIDKDCIGYEQGLTKMNETLLKNVRSAKNMLDKARLAVYKNKNLYDARGCIGALNTCMVDDMVCGDDYSKCLDPTKKYIDENGEVVLGQNISDIIKFMKDYDNSKINKEFLEESEKLAAGTCDEEGKCVVKYLLSKIGTGATVRDGGLCRAVMDKCQYSTYTDDVYQKYNIVVLNYVQRAMVNIKAAQQTAISDYAGNCMIDIATCYNQQVSQVNAWSSGSNTSSVYNVMRGACRNVAITCSYAVFAEALDANGEEICPKDASVVSKDKCIDEISKMFYQSLLCPENSTYRETGAPTAAYVNDKCQCNTGFIPWNSVCTRTCEAGSARSSLTGICETCKPGYYSPTANATSCLSCAAGSYVDISGAIVCNSCPAEFYCPAATKDPIKCPADKPKSTSGTNKSIDDCTV